MIAYSNFTINKTKSNYKRQVYLVIVFDFIYESFQTFH